MIRTVILENGEFLVTDDPEQVIGTALALITNSSNRPRIAERLAPNGDGFTLDTIGTVARIEARGDLPEPWDQDPTLDPSTAELWALYRDPDRDDPYVRHTLVITGAELRALVAQALILRGDA
jgi:hypothetical protein